MLSETNLPSGQKSQHSKDEQRQGGPSQVLASQLKDARALGQSDTSAQLNERDGPQHSMP